MSIKFLTNSAAAKEKLWHSSHVWSVGVLASRCLGAFSQYREGDGNGIPLLKSPSYFCRKRRGCFVKVEDIFFHSFALRCGRGGKFFDDDNKL